MQSAIRKMTQTAGIVAAAYKIGDGELHVAHRGAPHNEKAIMQNVVAMLDLIQDDPDTWERSVSPTRALMKLDIGDNTWNAGRQDGVTFILVSVKGHPVAKSLKRVLRSGFKKAMKYQNKPAPVRVPTPVSAPATLRVLPTPSDSAAPLQPELGVPTPVSDHAKTTKIDTTT